MQKKSIVFRRAYTFWKNKVNAKILIVKGTDFPNEYVRKVLLREDLAFLIKRNLYLLKDKGEEAQGLIYQSYWQIIYEFLKIYMPWSIEKESALNLYLGNESIPSVLKVRTNRNIKYSFSIPYGLKIQIRPDATFHEKTRQYFEIGKTRLFLDIPEKVLFSIQNRNEINFIAFIRGIKFDKRTLEILYSSNPKPIVAKELINMAKKCKRNDLAIALKEILTKYSIYRF